MQLLPSTFSTCKHKLHKILCTTLHLTEIMLQPIVIRSLTRKKQVSWKNLEKTAK